MTDLVYVPKRLVMAWLYKGWTPVDPIDGRDYAVLMAPPKTKIEDKHAVKIEEASKVHGSSRAFSLLCEEGGHTDKGGQGVQSGGRRNGHSVRQEEEA